MEVQSLEITLSFIIFCPLYDINNIRMNCWENRQLSWTGFGEVRGHNVPKISKMLLKHVLGPLETLSSYLLFTLFFAHH